MARDDIERARTDRSGGAEHCDRSHGANGGCSDLFRMGVTGLCARRSQGRRRRQTGRLSSWRTD